MWQGELTQGMKDENYVHEAVLACGIRVGDQLELYNAISHLRQDSESWDTAIARLAKIETDPLSALIISALG